MPATAGTDFLVMFQLMESEAFALNEVAIAFAWQTCSKSVGSNTVQAVKGTALSPLLLLLDNFTYLIT